MATAQLGAVVRHIRDLAVGPKVNEPTDGTLLRAFLGRNDQAAFEALVRRHGPMVLRVCRRTLGDTHDAEDALQATFLVLAQKAASIRRRKSLASWLHGVAHRMATHAKRAAGRRHIHQAEARPAPPDPAVLAAWQELQALLDEEVQRLPENLRAAFVCCCLESKSSAEAAHELRLKDATVRKRLSRARTLLQKRLTLRGVSLTAVLTAAALGMNAAMAAVPRPLVASTVTAASQLIGGEVMTKVVSANVASLIKGGMKAMFLIKLEVATAGLLLVSLVVSGALIAGLNATPESAVAAQPAAKNQDNPPADRAGADAKQAEQETVKVVKPGADHICSMAYCNGGKTVALVLGKPDRRSVVLWDVQHQKVEHTLQKFDEDPPFQFWNATSSKDGTRIAVSGGRRLAGAIKLWDAKTGKLVRTVELQGNIRVVALSADGNKLVGGTVFGKVADKVFVWDVKTGEVLQTLEADGMFYYSAAISDDGKWIAGAGATDPEMSKGKVIVWDAETGNVKHEWADLGPMSVVAFSPDGKLVAAGGPNEKTIRLWDMETGKLKHDLKPEGDHQISSGLAFSPDGKKLATAGCLDARVSLWDLTKENSRVTLEGHDGNVLCVAFSPDGRTLVSGGDDGTVRFWPVGLPEGTEKRAPQESKSEVTHGSITLASGQPPAPRTTTGDAKAADSFHSFLNSLRYPPGELYGARNEEATAHGKVIELVHAYARAKDEKERGKVKAELSKALGEEFDLGQKRRHMELDWAESEVKKARETLGKRADERRGIIDRRLEQLVNEADGLGWTELRGVPGPQAKPESRPGEQE